MSKISYNLTSEYFILTEFPLKLFYEGFQANKFN